MGNAGQSNYAASKAGLIGFTKSIAREYGERNIRANVVAPGLIKTRMTDELDERSKEVIIKSILLKRYGEPQDVASAVYFLLSEYGAYITGEVINVNGVYICSACREALALYKVSYIFLDVLKFNEYSECSDGQ
jgi:3-oxoacyl-[acyl-carrier protein] reductase